MKIKSNVSTALLKGVYAGTFIDLAVDADGNLITIIRGAAGNDVAVDASGNLSAAMKGLEGANVRDIAVDANGNMVALMKGDDGVNLQTIKVDSNGQMYIAMTGQSLSVNNHPSDYFKADESAVVKGDDGGTKRLIAVDTSGIMLSRMKGAYGGVLKDILLDDTGIMLSRMKGSYGGTLKDIEVDTDGNMISVMKGNYGGVLKTWKVDTDGRGEMFISDPADIWGNVVPMGLAEHAVRAQAPPMAFDRRGDMMQWEDFQSPTRHVEITTSGSGTANRSTDVSKTGDFTLKATVAAAADAVHISSGSSDFHLNRVGQQVVFSADSDNYRMKILVLYYIGTNGLYWEAYYDGATGNMVMLDHNLNETTLGTVKRVNDLDMFASLKIVVDMDTMKGVRLICFGNEYDISGYAPYTFVIASQPRSLTHKFRIYGTAAGSANVYVDNMIVTGNEPA